MALAMWAVILLFINLIATAGANIINGLFTSDKQKATTDYQPDKEANSTAIHGKNKRGNHAGKLHGAAITSKVRLLFSDSVFHINASITSL
ncbi:MAG TPA: hypothetical protein ENJ60_04265 [Aeromonadales bacterium]|nr:hypothetical protein [Aeromonadales bacterium]